MQIRDLIPWRRHRETPPARPAGEPADHPLFALHQDINREFDEFWRRFESGAPGFGMTGFGGLPGFGQFASPSVDVAETDAAVEVSVELPGLDEKDVEVSVADDVLTIRGERRDERTQDRKGYHLAERSYGSFHRAIPLPPGVAVDRASATFERGVLTVTLPKSEEARTRVRKIQVKAA